MVIPDYISNIALLSNILDDLNYKSNDFETIWVEVESKSDKNILFCCTYLNSDVEGFSTYFQSILIYSNLISIYAFVMGDFNINLNYDTHTP